MSMKRGLMRATDQQLQATAGRNSTASGRSPNTQRGLPRVNVPTTPPGPSRHDTAPQGSRRDTTPQAPRAGFRLRALTPPPRETLPFSPDPEATLSYDGHALARGFDFEARRLSTMPLSPHELERLGVAETTTPTLESLASRATLPVSMPPSNVIPLPTARTRGLREIDLDLGLARHENDPQRQSALLGLSGIRTRNTLPWIIAGLGVGFGALGLAVAFF